MSLQKAGSDLDNEIAHVINEATNAKVHAHSMRGSGNTKHAEADVLVRTPLNDRVIEAKRSSVATGEYAYVLDEDDTRQLSALSNDYTTAWVLVKFTNREPVLFRTPKGGVRVERIPSAFDPYTDEDAEYELRLTKPSPDDWPSAQAGRSLEDVLVEQLSLDKWVSDDE